MAVVKVRNSAHSHELRLFDIDSDGIVIGAPTPTLDALLTGRPRLTTATRTPKARKAG